MTSVTGVNRPLRADARRNRARILEAAEAVFAAKGAGAGVDEVAAAAQLGVGTLYRHFPTKDDLITAILFERMHRLLDDGYGYLEAKNPDEGLLDFLTQIVDQAAEKQDLTEVMSGSSMEWASASSPPPEVTELMDGLRNVTEKLLVRAQTEGSIRRDLNADDLVGLVMGPCMACGSPLVNTPSPHKMLAVLFDGLRRT